MDAILIAGIVLFVLTVAGIMVYREWDAGRLPRQSIPNTALTEYELGPTFNNDTTGKSSAPHITISDAGTNYVPPVIKGPNIIPVHPSAPPVKHLHSWEPVKDMFGETKSYKCAGCPATKEK